MTGRNSRFFALGRTGAVALLGFGMALGYLGYPWFAPVRDEAHSDDAPQHVDEGNLAGAAGIVRIPLEIQGASGLTIRPAEVRQFESSLEVTGTVAADETRVARIQPLARGVIEEVFVGLGDRVDTGDSVVSYDNIDLGQSVGEFLVASADLRSSATTLEVNETLLARSREMLEVNAVARTEHDMMEAEFRSAQARVDSARALVVRIEEQLHRFGLTDADLAKLSETGGSGYHRTVSRAALRTPSAGVVTALDVVPGDVIDPFRELLTVTDLSVVWVLADVSERDFSAVRVGKPVSIRIPTYPGEIFPGRIVSAGDAVEPESRTARVRCSVENADGRLKLGMFATVNIPSGNTYEALAVPAEAIQEVRGESVVFVRRSGVEFEQRHVQTRLESDGWIEVTSGVGTGDAVIAAGSSLAKEHAASDLTEAEH